MSDIDDINSSPPNNRGAQLRHAAAGFLRYVEENPLATIAGALIVGVILARFAFLGNPKDY